MIRSATSKANFKEPHFLGWDESFGIIQDHRLQPSRTEHVAFSAYHKPIYQTTIEPIFCSSRDTTNSSVFQAQPSGLHCNGIKQVPLTSLCHRIVEEESRKQNIEDLRSSSGNSRQTKLNHKHMPHSDNRRVYVKHDYRDRYHDPIHKEPYCYSSSTIGGGSEAKGRGVKPRRGPRGGVIEPFPMKLHEMLTKVDREGFSDVVSWQPHGRCFVIHKPKKFVEDVMPKYFKQSKFTSFQRQVNLYGFRRITRGKDRGGYYHELLLRGRPDLCKLMVRRRIKGTGTKAAYSPATEPNFYAMETCVEKRTNLDTTPRHLKDTTTSFNKRDDSKVVANDSATMLLPDDIRSTQTTTTLIPDCALDYCQKMLTSTSMISLHSMTASIVPPIEALPLTALPCPPQLPSAGSNVDFGFDDIDDTIDLDLWPTLGIPNVSSSSSLSSTCSPSTSSSSSAFTPAPHSGDETVLGGIEINELDALILEDLEKLDTEA